MTVSEELPRTWFNQWREGKQLNELFSFLLLIYYTVSFDVLSQISKETDSTWYKRAVDL